MNEQIKKEIEDMSYIKMLKLWRHTPCGEQNKYFNGEAGVYFSKVMNEKREKLDIDELVIISKAVGW